MSTAKLLRPIVFVLSFFVILGIYTKLIGPIRLYINQVSTQKADTFDVSGQGSANVVPDQAEVSLGITATQPTVAAAQLQANTVIKNITQALKDNGVGDKDITTQNYSVNPNYDYREGNNKITGYTVNASLEVKLTDFDKLNAAIDAATKLGANQVGGISFTLSDKTKAAAENDARKQAIDQAKTKAESLAHVAGINLGPIVNVQESSSQPPIPIYRTMEAKADTGGQPAMPPTQIQPGSTEVNLTVTLSYDIL